MIHDDRLEIGGEVNLDRLTLGELRERFRRQRRRAVLDRATESYFLRASSESACSASRSSFTLAIEPSGRTTPPWLVPVCTEIFEMPGKCRAF